MQKKKLLSLLIATGLFLGVLPVGIQAEPMDKQLAKITEQVKGQLAIDANYTTFQGESRRNGLEQFWNLNWNNDKGDQLNISTNGDGKVMSYYRYDSEAQDQRYDSDFAPAFPQISLAQAQKIAQDFLNKVLEPTVETFKFTDTLAYNEMRKTGQYQFSGVIYLNGLMSPIDASISIDSGMQAVVNFNRSDAWRNYLGGIPSAQPAATKQQAAESLKETLALKLEYLADPDHEGKAVLRYLPVIKGDYLVDAQTGDLISKAELFDEIKGEGTADSGSNEKVMLDKSKLTPAELEGIDKLKELLSSEVIDGKLQGMKELGLKGYTLAEASYSYDRGADRYTSRLIYALKTGKGEELKITRKYVTVDAKNGKLISLSTNYPYTEEQPKATMTEAVAEKTARDFLANYFSDNYNKTKRYSVDSEAARTILPLSENRRSMSYNFAQFVNGYYFPENNYNVSVDVVSGAIDYFSGNFRQFDFEAPEGIISQKQALQSYFEAYQVVLGYQSLPQKIDLSAPEWRPYIEQGQTYLYELRLGYVLNADQKPWAIDAKSGKPLYHRNQSNGPISYDDINKVSEKVKTLAKYGIGFSGGSFKPEQPLTQVDMLALLISASGYRYNPQDKTGDLETLYERAYQLGILDKAQRNPTKLIDRTDIIKSILNMSGYGQAASLPGIYISKYTDQNNIPVEDLGYAAICQGLGLIKDMEFLPKRILTRQQAADILYNFLSRK